MELTARLRIRRNKTMQKPNNFENVKAGGDFTPIELGGHHLIIKNVEETTSKAGSPMLKVYFDFAKNDRQPDYMATEFKNDIRPDKKWPYSGTQYIVVTDKDGNTSKSFKSFITSVENSNKGFKAAWGAVFCDQFKNKLVGGVYGIVESEYNGERKKRSQLRWFCEDSKADSAATPEPKLLASNNVTQSADGFLNVPSGTDEEVPF
jgi:hypothetical protein